MSVFEIAYKYIVSREERKFHGKQWAWVLELTSLQVTLH